MTKPKNVKERIVKSETRFWQALFQKFIKLNRGLNSWPKIIAIALKETFKPDTGVLAAAVAYFAFLSIFPLVLLSVSVSSLWLGRLVDEAKIIQELEFIAPALGQLLGRNLAEIVELRGAVSGFAMVGLVWSASSIFNMLNRAQGAIWKHEQAPATWKRRGIAILIVLVVAGPLLFVASFAGSTLGSIQHYIPDSIFHIGNELTLLYSIILDILMFFTMYILLPHGDSTWKDNIWGAVLAGLLWEVAKKVFLYFITTYLSTSNLVYGSLAAIIAFMTWAYFSCLIFFFGGYVNHGFYKYNLRKIEIKLH